MKTDITKYTHKYKGQTVTLKKRGRNWNIDWMFDGQSIRQSLKTPNITDAKTLAEALIEKAVGGNGARSPRQNRSLETGVRSASLSALFEKVERRWGWLILPWKITI